MELTQKEAMRAYLRQGYAQLLYKLCDNTDLQNLYHQCIIDDIRTREDIYNETGKYPEKRDIFGKLMSDLESARQGKLKRGK